MSQKDKAKRADVRLGVPSRLADMVGAFDWYLPPWCDPRSESTAQWCLAYREKIAQEISRSPVIVADNVCEYLFADNPQEVWDYNTDFPVCTLPFDSCLIEVGRPSRIHSEGEFRSSRTMPARWGWMLKTMTVEDAVRALDDEGLRKAKMAEMADQLKHLHAKMDQAKVLAAVRSGDPKAVEDLPPAERTFAMLGAVYKALESGQSINDQMFPEGARWVVHGDLILCNDRRVMPAATVDFVVSESGPILGVPNFGTFGGKNLPIDQLEELRHTWSSMLFPAMLAVSFMNCKNVAVQRHEPDKKLNRMRLANGRKPFLRYHTIDIEPMKSTLRGEGNIAANGIKRALHICRGHFATLTRNSKGEALERPTTYWRAAHVRGSAREGVVVSDYRVKAPSEPKS